MRRCHSLSELCSGRRVSLAVVRYSYCCAATSLPGQGSDFPSSAGRAPFCQRPDTSSFVPHSLHLNHSSGDGVVSFSGSDLWASPVAR
jgi:hypothetical protein